jgi:hypothetical protein
LRMAPPTLKLLIPAVERWSTLSGYAKELSAASVPLDEKIQVARV